jgi:hypothetical protein
MPDAMSLSVFLRHSTRKLWYARRESTHIDREGEVVAVEALDALQALCYAQPQPDVVRFVRLQEGVGAGHDEVRLVEGVERDGPGVALGEIEDADERRRDPFPA